MQTYKLFRETHKWIGLALSVIRINVSVTGLLLLKKKPYDWLRPAYVRSRQRRKTPSTIE